MNDGSEIEDEITAIIKILFASLSFTHVSS